MENIRSWCCCLNTHTHLKRFVPLESPLSRSSTPSIFAGAGLSWVSVTCHQKANISPTPTTPKIIEAVHLQKKNCYWFSLYDHLSWKAGKAQSAQLERRTRASVTLGQRAHSPLLCPSKFYISQQFLSNWGLQSTLLIVCFSSIISKRKKIEWKKKYAYRESQWQHLMLFIPFSNKIGIILFFVFGPFYSLVSIFHFWVNLEEQSPAFLVPIRLISIDWGKEGPPSSQTLRRHVTQTPQPAPGGLWPVALVKATKQGAH